MADRGGEGERSGDDEGLRGGDGNLDPERDFLEFAGPSPISRAYGDIDERRRPCCRARFSFSSNSISTSCISAATPSSGLIANPSLSMRPPKMRNKADARKLVNRFGINVGTAWPNTAESMVMAINAEKAAENTSNRSCFMAINAAIRKVLSPTSENRIMVRERRKECRGWMRPSFSSSPCILTEESTLDSDFEISRWSLFAELGSGCGLLLSFCGRSLGFCKESQKS